MAYQVTSRECEIESAKLYVLDINWP